jgi:iron complex outermembrane receptor protein
MFKRTGVSAALAIAFGGALAVAAVPGMAQQSEQKLERVEITGSAIKRVDAEGPVPVEVYTRKEIARTGATTVNELIRSIPSIDIFDQGELASNSPSGSGTANIGMRGLDSSNVLVLLNGRRLPVNALYDSSGAGAAFDVNTIPLSAVERVEILKDGGSAIYGADAVAGVFNIITKKDYQGIEIRAGYGTSSRSDGTEKQAGLVAGFGSLKDNRVNVLVGLDVFKRDPIFRKDRDISRTVDFRRFGSPRDGRSSFAPQGNIVDPATGGFVGVPYRACPPENLSGGTCRYDFNASILTAYNGADRVSGMALATVQLNPETRGFAELTIAESKDHFEAHPVPDFFNVPIIDPATQSAFEDPANRGTVVIAGRFMQGGPRITDRKAALTNLVLGAEGVVSNLDWKANIGRGTSKVTNSDQNYYNSTAWVNATTSGALDPTVNTNDPALVESLKVRPVRKGESTITSANFLVSGDATELPAGTLRYAVGSSAWQEQLTDTPDALTQAGLVVGSIQQAAVSASRRAKAVFGELAIPVHKTLEAQAALRYDSYPQASQSSPKAAIKYTPTPELALRASYTASFRVPALKQLFGAQEEGAITITNEEDCALLGVPCGTGLNAFQVNGSNANLKPEKGKTWNFGVLMDLGQYVNLGIDYWKIEKTDEINAPTIESALRQGLFVRDGARFRIFTNLQNLAERTTSGVDVDGSLRIPGTPIGSLVIRNMVTYNIHNLRRDNPTDDLQEFVGTYATPRFRNTFSVSSEMGPWNWRAAIRTVGGFRDEDDPETINAGTRRVGAHEELDVQGQFLGFKDLTITAGIRNLLDRQPPLSILNGTDNQYTQMGFAELYTSRGRFLYASLSYKF